MDLSVLWRAAAVQAVSVAVLSVALAVALPHDFFEQWGWLAGPGAWMLCAAITATVVRLPLTRVLVWLGAAIAIVLFALWCARLAREPGLPARAV